MAVYQILLICKNNSVLSPMAEAYLKLLCDTKVKVYSAGIELTPPDPVMLKVLEEDGVGLRDFRQHALSDLREVEFDFILTFDEESEDESHHFPSRSVKYHYQFDPYLYRDESEDKTDHFRTLRNKIKKIITAFKREYFD